MSKFFYKFNAGFSLLEMILYVSLVGVLMFTIYFFGFSIQGSWLKNQSILEVEDQGSQSLRVILKEIQRAESINFPLPGSVSSSLSLILSNPTTTVIFGSSSSRIFMTSGTQTPVFLTGNQTLVSNLSFANFSRSGTPGIIQVSFRLENLNIDGRVESSYGGFFSGSATLK